MNNTIITLSQSLSTQEEDIMNLTRTNKLQQFEIAKAKERMIKMKNRRGKIDLGIKLCKNCTKEFHESDNFNWSCKTHKSDYGGEMWWCCGKKDL